MKKIILLLLSLVLVFGIANIALAATEDKEESVTVKAEIEDVQEETVIEEPVIEAETEAVEVVEEDETSCPHTWGEWYYDLIEHEDGSVTYFRYCDCGAYEELEEQTFYELGGQYEDCDKGRHYWREIRYCDECGAYEEII